MINKAALIRAGIVAGRLLAAHPDSQIVIIPPETHNHIGGTKYAQEAYKDDGPAEWTELRHWSNGTDSFHIGYSEKQKTLFIAFSEAL